MSGFEILLIVIVALFVANLYYTNFKSEKVAKKSKILASAIEELNRDVYKIENKIKDIEHEISEQRNSNETEISEDVVKSMVNSKIENLATEVVNSLHEIESSFAEFKSQNEQKIMLLEDNIRSMSVPKSLSGGVDDNQIFNLFQQGMSIDMIARELRLPKAEVEFSLKLNKMR